MDSLGFQSLIGIKKSCKPLFKFDDELQIWVGRLKPTSVASEVSIPDRDYSPP
jgi:hypothetical protein